MKKKIHDILKTRTCLKHLETCTFDESFRHLLVTNISNSCKTKQTRICPTGSRQLFLYVNECSLFPFQRLFLYLNEC